MDEELEETTWQCPRCYRVNEGFAPRCPACGFANPEATVEELKFAKHPFEREGPFRLKPVHAAAVLAVVTVVGAVLQHTVRQSTSASRTEIPTYTEACATALQEMANNQPVDQACRYAPGTATLRYHPKNRSHAAYYTWDVVTNDGAEHDDVSVYDHGRPAMTSPEAPKNMPTQATVETWDGHLTCVIVGSDHYYTREAPPEAAKIYSADLVVWTALDWLDAVAWIGVGGWALYRHLRQGGYI